jgi:RNA polymerase sigma-70 factor (ECF subfamily)
MAEALQPELVARAVAGEAGAIDSLLRVAQVDIRRYARRSCRSASDAEEAAQEALIILYRRIGTLREIGAISAWLLRIVNRFCLRLALRLAGVRSAIEAEAAERHFAAIAKPELRLDIARAIQSLPEHYRAVVVLRDLEELTIDEIALRLDTTRETVKARLHRARALMREYLLDE